MAEFTYNPVQTVATGANVLFSDTPIKPSKCIWHREGSGIVTLRGLTDQCRALFKVSFGGNIAAVTAAGAISVAISINGEPLESSTMTVTTAGAAAYFNVYGESIIEVPKGCCLSIAVENTSDQSITVQNANLIVERVA